MDRKEVYIFVIMFVLILSISAVSAFNLTDWVKEIFGKGKITGNAVYETPDEVVVVRDGAQIFYDLGDAKDGPDGFSVPLGTMCQIGNSVPVQGQDYGFENPQSTVINYWYVYCFHEGGADWGEAIGWIAEPAIEKVLLPESYYWMMNENAWSGVAGEVRDSISGKNGRAVNGAQIKNIGVNGKAGSFDGEDDYVIVEDLSLTQEKLTVSFWFNSDDVTNVKRIVEHDWKDGIFGGVFTTHLDQGSVGAALAFSDNSFAFLSAQGVEPNQFYMFTLTYDGAVFKIYLNGQERASTNVNKPLRKKEASLIVGMLGQAWSYKGYIDDIKIYDGRALSSSDVLALYLGSNSNVVTQIQDDNVRNGLYVSNGFCGVQNYSCVEGNVSDVNSNTTHYLWGCEGINGGTNASCGMLKNNSICIDGDGGLNFSVRSYSSNGTLTLNDSCNRSVLYEAFCNGDLLQYNVTYCANGCSSGKCLAVFINGRCNSRLDSCLNGTFFNITDSGTHYLWMCNGINGGTSASCSLLKRTSSSSTGGGDGSAGRGSEGNYISESNRQSQTIVTSSNSSNLTGQSDNSFWTSKSAVQIYLIVGVCLVLFVLWVVATFLSPTL